ncbi:MAG: glycosyltransferase [Candidatus Beckwithbacteria bacterium]|nr:glycosyltransferase [Candidatus Beckwithbacteria bacterium]
MSRIGLYSPFLADNIGGGERYLLTVAECLLPKHRVDLIIPRNKIKLISGLKQKFTDNFHLKLDGLNVIPGPFGPGSSAWGRWQFTGGYDVFYYMTDASFFVSGAKRNIAHFMIPFNRPPGLIQRLKLNTWQVKTTHSFFCKQALERIWKIKINFVHWGAVDTEIFVPQPKQNLIVSVGRWFSPSLNKHCKRQDFLVKTFRKMCDQGLVGWRLKLIGPVDKGKDNLNYFNRVKSLAQGYPIDLPSKTSFDSLLQAYGQAKIYWHATGYRIDEQTNPQAAEHFGISTIEAMAAAAVPVVIKKGGQTEIVNHAVDGLLWQTQPQLIQQTGELIDDQKLWQKLSTQAQKRAKDFSLIKFCQTTRKIFNL